MLYHYIPERTPEIPLKSSTPEVFHHSHTFGVVIPYSSNLKERNESTKGEERLSFYSAFALNTAIEMYEDRKFQKFVLLSDATFGEARKSTGHLMKDALLRLNLTRPIQETDIILLDAVHLNNTPAQLKELAKYQRNNNLQNEPFLLIDWEFHDKRIHFYIQGFGLKADTINVEEAHKYYNPKFHLAKLQRVLPQDFEEREEKLRLLARFDKHGFIPRLLKMLTGPVVTDIKKIQDSASNGVSLNGANVHLVFENISGKEKLRLLEKIK